MERAYESDMTGRKKLSLKMRVLVVMLTTVILLGSAACGGFYILLNGPSAYAGRQFALAVQESPVAGSIVRMVAGDQIFLQDSEPSMYSIYPQIK